LFKAANSILVYLIVLMLLRNLLELNSMTIRLAKKLELMKEKDHNEFQKSNENLFKEVYNEQANLPLIQCDVNNSY
jgi:endonuclease III-like uncharacterized protein